jgi:hypothetical protein
MRPLQFTRQAKEAAIYLLGSQRIFREFLPERKLPLRFMRQPYFSQALHLFEIEARARGEEPAGLSWPTGERTPPWKRREKRHRRKKKRAFFSDQKPKENHLPNLPEIPNL